MELKYSVGFLLFGLVLVLQKVSPADAIQCYTCSLMGCEDDFDPNAKGVTKETCRGSCMKTKTDQGVIRLCAETPMAEDVCEERDGTHACFCTSDLCNGGSHVHVSLATAMILLTGFLLTVMF